MSAVCIGFTAISAMLPVALTFILNEKGEVMAKKPIHVTSEIGDLQRVVLHRPGRDSHEGRGVRSAGSTTRYLGTPKGARRLREHSARGRLRVLYMEELLAEAMDANPVARAAFLDEYMAQAPFPIRRSCRSCAEAGRLEGNRELVAKALAGMRLHELDLASGPRTLSRLEGDGLAPDDFVVYSMPSSYFSRDPIASIGTGWRCTACATNQRNREVPFYKTFLTYHPDFAGTPFWYDNHSAAHRGRRRCSTSTDHAGGGHFRAHRAAAIDTLAHNLFWGEEPRP